MNQPKFKFGDVVKIKNSDKSFKITHMRFCFPEIGVQYWGENNNSLVYPESELELFQEPQKKKLYAYIENKKQVHFVLNEGEDIMSGQFRINPSCVRAPEYDIEYPEAT